ncbi:DUF3099 domain-containing protein [Corynebacterium glucuronolyticum]|uniref:DUF3099 domain-containing protein n=3 Tax=Corynebacterium glucuronolyticum TaxID=39791 RepID=A0AAX1L5C4_9CORY|nr:hypothetical protein HMPREF0293_1578 [Corynebacterium glucuronolyticum ATCC 51866]QRP69644.1 DUF3099 domain-containing protein [Corynebacterium glucuronolyticum]
MPQFPRKCSIGFNLVDMTGPYPGENSSRHDPGDAEASRSHDSASSSPFSGQDDREETTTDTTGVFSSLVIDADEEESHDDTSQGSRLRHWWSAHARRSSSVELITDQEKRTPWQNHEHRKVLYMWLQGMRIPFLIMSAITYLVWHSILLSWVLFLISIPLPWISVVIANGVGEPRDKREQNVYKPERFRAEQAHSAYAALHAPIPADGGQQSPPALEPGSTRREDMTPTH